MQILLLETFLKSLTEKADQSDRAILVTNRLLPLEHWDCGFESYSRHECLCAFILRLCCLAQVVAFRRADPPSKESYRLPTGLKK
jgi:hypothetical protein